MSSVTPSRELVMTHFSVGDQVIIRFGSHQGQKAIIMKTQPTDAYKVKVEDGSVLFFTSKGLKREKEPAR
jgi:ribosomal protein L24